METVDSALAAVGMLFVLFLVVATVSEQIIEVFRGSLETFGIKILKSGVSIEEATKLATEFLPSGEAGKEARGKVAALFVVAKDYPKTLKGKLADLEQLKADLKTIDFGSEAPGEEVKAFFSDLTDQVRVVTSLVEGNESTRIWVLRLISFFVCFLICGVTRFDAIGMVVAANPEMLSGMKGFYTNGTGLEPWKWLGLLFTAVAASAGSSYWHDQLDRVRAMKSVSTSVKAISK